MRIYKNIIPQNNVYKFNCITAGIVGINLNPFNSKLIIVFNPIKCSTNIVVVNRFFIV